MEDRHGDYPSSERPEDRLDLASQLEALRRRIWPMLAVFVLVLGIATAVSLLWPPTYRSMGTILIEQQEVPLDFVRSAVTSYADERVEIISQRVMTSANLMEIIEKYNLFPDERESMTREQLVNRMRENVKREMISAEVVDPRAGRATQATIAFAVGFESPSPDLAAKVANDLITLYLKKNIETRTQLAAGTTVFLSEETEKLRASIAQIEQKIADFKQRNYDRLPEFAQSTTQMLLNANQEAREIDARAQVLSQQLDFLDRQLAQVNPYLPTVTDSGQTIMDASSRLRAMRDQYLSQLALYTPKHPSVASLKQELYSLELHTGGGSAAVNQLDSIEKGYTQLAEARTRRPTDDAEIQRVELLVRELVDRYKKLPIRSAHIDPGSDADNPAYVSLQAQRQSASAERSMLLARRADVSARIAALESRQLETPAVERDYAALMRELQSEQAKYNEIRQKLLDAQLAQNLEAEQKGERFTLIEPPLRPQEPIKPNRLAILALGVMCAFASAIGLMMLLELMDTRIRGRRQVLGLLGVPPLAIIPWVAEDDKPRRLAWLRRLLPHRRGPSEAPAGA